MQTYLFSLVVQAAGTVLLFVVFLLLYRKFRRPAFLDWIASWGFFLIGLVLWGLTLAPLVEPTRPALLALVLALLAHVFFLLRGVWRSRQERPVSRPAEMLWAVPILALAWWLSANPLVPAVGWAAPISFLRAAAYVVTAFAFAMTPGSPGGRGILSASFLLWGAERAILGFAYLRYRDVAAMPETLQYAYFLEMFLEMTIGVGIIILLFEASQVQLRAEMQKLVESDSQAKEMGIRDRADGPLQPALLQRRDPAGARPRPAATGRRSRSSSSTSTASRRSTTCGAIRSATRCSSSWRTT